jgi:hypothetical protein
MANKIPSKFSGPRPDRFSKKRSGMVAQTVRFTVEENKLVRKAATEKRMSISAWSSLVLLREAERIVDRMRKPKEETEVVA